MFDYKLGERIDFKFFDKVIGKECHIQGAFLEYEDMDLVGKTVKLMHFIDDFGRRSVINLSFFEAA